MHEKDKQPRREWSIRLSFAELPRGMSGKDLEAYEGSGYPSFVQHLGRTCYAFFVFHCWFYPRLLSCPLRE